MEEYIVLLKSRNTPHTRINTIVRAATLSHCVEIVRENFEKTKYEITAIGIKIGEDYKEA